MAKKDKSTNGGTFEQALQHLRSKGHFARETIDIERIKTGLVGLDYLMGGGVPRGRVLEFYGFEHSGKTTIAAECARAFQQNGLRVLYLDYEHSVDLHYFASIGVESCPETVGEKWLYEQPDYLEQGGDIAKQLVETGGIGLVIIDSVAGMVPKDELDGNLEDYTIGLQARKMGQLLRMLVGVLKKTNTAAIFVNQLRDKIGVTARFDPTITPGGKALKFNASVRMEFKRRGTAQNVEGTSFHRALLKKQKTCSVLRGVTEFTITPRGVDPIEHLRTCLTSVGIVTNRSGSFFFGDQKLCRGSEKFLHYLSDVKQREPLVRALLNHWSKCWEAGAEHDAFDVMDENEE